MTRAALALAIACSAPEVAPPPPAVPTTPQEPEVLLDPTFIQDGDVGVSVVETLLVPFHGELDPTQVHGVTLSDDVWDARVEAAVRIDEGAKLIIVDPAWPLEHGRRYVLDLDGLVGTDGRAVAPLEIRFETTFNVMVWTRTLELDHDDRGRPVEEISTMGLVEEHVRWITTWDDAAMRATRVHYIDRGADYRWGTDDDAQGTIEEQLYDERGFVHTIWRWHCGGDQRCGTADDQLRSVTHREPDPLGRGVARSLTSIEPGADGQWGTDDDVVSEWEEATFEDLTGSSAHDQLYAGPDGRPGTSDDIPWERVVVDRFPRRVIRRVILPGTDGVLGTFDDIILREHVSELDEQGLEIEVWTPPSRHQLAVYEYDEQGNRVRKIAADVTGEHATAERWETF